MADFSTSKNEFNMQKLSAEMEQYCKNNNIEVRIFAQMLLVTEEYLTNILFPNFDGGVEISVSNTDKGILLYFFHTGADYMNKITDNSFLSLKILQNKTKEMKSYAKDGGAAAEFLL